MLKFFNKEFLSNFIGLSSINIIGMLIPIITMPYLSRVLGVNGYGTVLLFSTLSIFMLIIIDYSTNITGVRDAAEKKGDKEALNYVYSRYQRIRFLLTLLFIPLSLIYCHFFIPGFSLLFYFEVMVASAVGYYLSAPWFHQGTSTLKFFSLVTVATRILQLLLIFVFVKDHDSVSSAVRLNAYAFLIAGVIMYIYRLHRIKVKKISNTNSIGKDFKEGLDAFIGEFAPNLYSNIPPLVIGAIVSPMVFACYSIALRIINIAGSFQAIAAKSVYPMVVKGKSTLKALLLINLSLSAIPFIAIILFRKEIIYLFLGQGYELAQKYLLLCSPGIVLYSILCSFSYGFFLPQRLDTHFKRISIISSILPAVVCYPLIQIYHAYGAILMLLMARLLFASLFAYYYFKLKKGSAI
ncbi:lipopolysaccharide biosynthesis protein [Erwinia oleae]|uniref:lipopolysaccharide biosynthesis protein n=1 Tax=Erwinia oleae TaxID=796334 RepID=UPI000550DA15|nr:oligosaccharide flippase family protein [Erwinia oleae]